MNDWFARYEEAVQQNRIDADVIKAQAATIERFREFVGLADTYFGGDWWEPGILYPETLFARMKVSRKNLSSCMGVE